MTTKIRHLLSLFLLGFNLSSCISNANEIATFTKRTIQSLEGNNIIRFQEGEKVKLAGLPDNERTQAFIRANLEKQEEVSILWDSHYDNEGNMLAYIYTKNGICLNTKALQEGKIKADVSYAYDSLEVYQSTLSKKAPEYHATSEGKSLEELYEELKKSVVVVYSKNNSLFSNSISLGSGSFISEDGLILSNHHVYSSGMEGIVELKDGRTFPIIEVIEDNVELDYVIFKIDTKGNTFSPVKIVEEDSKIAEKIFVIGNPEGMKFTITQGIISNIDQGQRSGDIMTDAAVNHGNSGGPMFNMKGEVIGLITYKRGASCENCGFALDIRKIKFP